LLWWISKNSAKYALFLFTPLSHFAIIRPVMGESISYKLETFEGPLDLLLHLIDKDKVNIYDIPIASITAQYLEYMAQMPQTDLNRTSEFMVMAATLLEIKAKMLLPKEVDPETGEEVDPRAELVERLIEHRKMKLLAGELADLEVDAQKHFYKGPTIPKEVAKYEQPVDLDNLLADVNLAKLQEIFTQVMKRKDDRIDPERSKFGTIKREKISLETKIKNLIEYTKTNKNFSFKKLLESQPSRLEVVVTFLGILELTKAGLLSIVQEELGDDIQIEVNELQGPDAELDLSGLEDFES